MSYLFEGKISIKALINTSYRKVNCILIDEQKKDKDTNYIIHKAKEKGTRVQLCKRSEIDELANGKTHGGILAYGDERSFQTIDEIMNEHTFIALIEGIEDPYNFAYVLRSLYAAGVDGIIVSSRNWTSAASVLAKASAGASEFIKIVISEDFEETLQYLKKQQVQIVCANRNKNAIEMYDYDFKQSVCICIGGEKRGLSRIVQDASDQDIYIPYQNDFKNALSAASASTIIAYELFRQRKQ